ADQHPSHRRAHRPLGDLALHLAPGEPRRPAGQVPRIAHVLVHATPGAVDHDGEMEGGADGGSGVAHGATLTAPASRAPCAALTVAPTASSQLVATSPSSRPRRPGTCTHGPYQSPEIPWSSRAKVLKGASRESAARGIGIGRRADVPTSRDTSAIS